MATEDMLDTPKHRMYFGNAWVFWPAFWCFENTRKSLSPNMSFKKFCHEALFMKTHLLYWPL